MSIPTIRLRFSPDTPRLRARVLPSIPPLQVSMRNTGTAIQWQLGVGGVWQDLIEIEDINASVEIGTVTTLPAGDPATVANVGTAQDVVLDFGIPAGADGIMASVQPGSGIGVDSTDPANPVVAVEANLQEWNSVNPSANVVSLVSAADYAAIRALLDLEPGTDFYSISAADTAFQAKDSDLTDLAAKWVPASPSGPATMDFAEDTDNGTNRVRVSAPASLGSDVTVTLPSAAGTVLVGALGSTDNALLRADGTGAATAQGSAVTVDDSGNMSGLFSATMTIAQANNNSGGLSVQKRGTTGDSTAAVASGAELGYHGFFAWTGTQYVRPAVALAYAAEAITDAAMGGRYVIRTIAIGATGSGVERLNVASGVYHPSATGGDKGNNTINFGAVYDDNSLLTCMALQKQFLEHGEIDLDYWDGVVPNQVEPERREGVPVTVEVEVERIVTTRDEDGCLVRKTVLVKEARQLVEIDPVWDEHGNGIDAVETPVVREVVTPPRIIKREHRTARIFKVMIDGGFDPRDPEQYFAKMQADEALPGMPTKADWEHNGLSIGEQFGRKWLAMEMLAIVCNVMWGKLKEHESRISALETA